MKITRFLETTITLFSILVFGILLIANIRFDSYIFAGTNPIISDGDIILFLLSLILLIAVLFIFATDFLTKKTILILFIAINSVALIGRFIVLSSFEIVPTADMYRVVLAGAQIFLYGDFSSTLAGGYVNMFSNQFGVLTLLEPFVRNFEFDFNAYYIVNILLIQASILFLSGSFLLRNKLKESLFSTILLNLFLPNLFAIFIIYGDLFALFALSAFIFINLIKFKYKFIQTIFSFVLILMAQLARPTSIIWFIALLIVFFIYKKWNDFLKLLIALSLSLLFVQSLPLVYEARFAINIPETSLPFSTWVGIAFEKASVDKESPGFYTDEYFNYHVNNQYNVEKTNQYIIKDLNKNLNQLILKNELFNFQNEKIRILWTDPDFETMNFILPMNYALTKNDFRANNALRVGVASEGSHPKNTLGELLVRGMFQLRRFEKVMYLLMLLGAMIASIVNLKSRDKTLLVLQLLGIGFFLFFQFMEIKPRYLLVYMNFLVLHFVYGVAIISEQISSKLKKNP